MGLDFSHCDAHWSYSGFHFFRKRLAAEIRVELDEMAGFGGTGDWSKVKDPIVPLLNHSDCDGELTSDECKVVASRLRELVSDWSDDDRDKADALELAQGMELAASRSEHLEFY